MELTKEYFDEQLQNLATKNDLDGVKNDIADLKKFVQTNMVTKEELDDLREELPTQGDFSKLQQSVDGIAGQFQDQRQELLVGASRSERMEAWIIKAAEKIDVEYKP